MAAGPDAALAGARAAIEAISRSEFKELMQFANPPEALAQVCATALLAVGMPAERGWEDVKRGIIYDTETFRRALLSLDPAGVDPSRREVLSERLATIASTDMSKISKLAAVLSSWLKAVVNSQ